MKSILKKNRIGLIGFLLLGILSCQPSDDVKNNGGANPNVDASFQIIPDPSSPNKFTLNAEKPDILGSIWDLGDGKNEFLGNLSQKAFFPDAGTYIIKHKAIGRGGETNVLSKNLVVPVSDPNSGNLVQGGKFLNATDYVKWTILNIAGSHINWTFGNGFANVSGTSSTQYAQQGIYQAIQVSANKEYKIDMKVSGNPCLNTWFEVYVGTQIPIQGNDYSSGGKRISIKTFDNCLMTSAFSGQLAAISCEGSGNTISFPTSGTVYIVIRSGGFGNNTLGTGGVKLTNVEFRGK